MNSLYNFDINPLSDTYGVKIFSPEGAFKGNSHEDSKKREQERKLLPGLVWGVGGKDENRAF